MPHRTGPVAEEFASRVVAMESEWLSPLAVRSYETRGRLHVEDEICPLRTPFQRDRDRIVHCKSFRRLKGKTQVFIAPQGDHFRTRLTHTLEVSGISRNVARALWLNEDLTEAIALGHDLGHSPFGHAGENALDRILEERYGRGFRHNEHSLRIVDLLEHEGRGLNLTEEVRDGILHHTGPVEPDTLEGAIVRLVDRFAYVNHDIDDAVRAGILDPAALPGGPIASLGETSSQRIDALVHDLVETSRAAGAIGQTDEHRDALLELRGFMFDRVYLLRVAREHTAPVERIVEDLLGHFVDHPEELPAWFEGDDVTRATDWVAGMTDGYALRAHADLARVS
jgi:dGTPase